MKRLGYLGILLACSVVLSGCSLLNKDAKAGLQVMTNDVPSSVFLNDQYLNKTPLIQKDVQPQEYLLKIVPDDTSLASYETAVTLRDGLLTVVTWKPAATPELSGGVIYEMEPLKTKQQSEVSFVTIPDGAIISFDDREKEFSPVILTDVSPGNHEFEVTLPSYETQRHTLNVVEGYRMIVQVKLAKLGEGQSNPPPGSQPAPAETTPPIATSSGEAATSAGAVRRRATIKKTNYFEDGREVTKVRDAASTGGKEIGIAEVGSSYPYLDLTVAGWYKIKFGLQDGWVNSQYAQLSES